MALRGETLATGASHVCSECNRQVSKLSVLHSAAGYYIGTTCSCGPYSRESGYYKKKSEAQFDLDNGTFGR
jgi:hypothetical protein